MKTRIIYTKFWEDDYIGTLSPTEKTLFLYLLTNSRVGLGNIYECSDRVICFETGISNSQLVDIKKKFEKDMKFLFDDGYVYIVNNEKYNQYKGEKNESARTKEEEIIGKARVKAFEDRVSIPHIYPSDTSINHKSKIINKKPEIRNQKVGIREKELQEVVDYYNEVFKRNVKSTKGFERNFEVWRKIHSIEDIKKAIKKGYEDSFWKDKLTLTILFRTKNTNGEDVDYIEDLKNRIEKKGKWAGYKFV